MITMGIDCGAKNTKTIIMKDKQIIGKGKAFTDFDQIKAIEESVSNALKEAGIPPSDIKKIYGTGSGQQAIKQANELIDEIKSMAKAANYYFPNARTVFDVGAEDGRAARIDKNGKPVNFVVNERCAAGAGGFIEAMSNVLEISPEEMGSLALESTEEIPMNAHCVIFAESEAIGLMHANTEKKDISKAVHDAMAGRVVAMIRKIGINEDVVMLGGVALNPGFVNAMKIQLEIEKIYIPEYPEYGGAVGAALLAAL
jgi:benzoyl-CoA reductase subunit D